MGMPLTVTHSDMTRFVMTEDEACELVLKSVFEAESGETLVTKMHVMNIIDLATAMYQLEISDSKEPEINIIGAKPGEKLYEELTTSEEIRRTSNSGDYLRIISPFQYRPGDEVNSHTPEREYNSANEPSMSVDEIKNYLVENGLSQ
jgi:FlaA1/EpsC-like NDP-sugar epimerase